jgi:hypothetical protein
MHVIRHDFTNYLRMKGIPKQHSRARRANVFRIIVQAPQARFYCKIATALVNRGPQKNKLALESASLRGVGFRRLANDPFGMAKMRIYETTIARAKAAVKKPRSAKRKSINRTVKASYAPRAQ